MTPQSGWTGWTVPLDESFHDEMLIGKMRTLWISFLEGTFTCTVGVCWDFVVYFFGDLGYAQAISCVQSQFFTSKGLQFAVHPFLGTWDVWSPKTQGNQRGVHRKKEECKTGWEWLMVICHGSILWIFRSGVSFNKAHEAHHSRPPRRGGLF